jgi:two-component system KDP operon response regulator KdpE
VKSCDVLVIEDDPSIRDVIRRMLEPLGVKILEEADGLAGEARAREYSPPVIVLDLGLPSLSGLEILKKLKPWFKGSVVVITAWEDEEKKLEAFELGADDYVSKPFSPGELLARIKVALRRSASALESPSEVLSLGGLRMDLQEHRLQTDRGQVIQVTQIEFRFLALLARHPGSLMLQKDLLLEIWGPNHSSDTHYLRILVSRLRKKLEPFAAGVSILTEPGLGYRLVV